MCYESGGSSVKRQQIDCVRRIVGVLPLPRHDTTPVETDRHTPTVTSPSVQCLLPSGSRSTLASVVFVLSQLTPIPPYPLPPTSLLVLCHLFGCPRRLHCNASLLTDAGAGAGAGAG